MGGAGELGLIVAKSSSFASIFRYSYFNWITIEWIPTAAYTSPGVVAFAVDPNITGSNPTSVQSIVRHSKYAIGDIKQPLKFHIDGKDLRQSREYPLVHLNSASDEQKYSGVVQFWIDSEADSTVGYFKIQASIHFSQLTEN